MLDLKAEPWLAVGLAVLATWRVTHLLAREDGPFDVLARLRARLGRGFFGSLLDCFACVSVWVAAAVASLLTRDPGPWLVAWWGLSGAACWIDRFGQAPVVFEKLRDPESPPPTREPSP